ncbi:hypothetical protein GJ496_011202 [Pomphorhynchus laevis]|nr:hypothetical protein GJ496_011202 [Pomphorhynchus laevis]
MFNQGDQRRPTLSSISELSFDDHDIHKRRESSASMRSEIENSQLTSKLSTGFVVSQAHQRTQPQFNYHKFYIFCTVLLIIMLIAIAYSFLKMIDNMSRQM